MAINWEKAESGRFSNSILYDIGDIRIKLTERKCDWIMSVAVRAYSQDGKYNMYRPFENVERYEKPCSFEQVREHMGLYLEHVARGILDCMEETEVG